MSHDTIPGWMLARAATCPLCAAAAHHIRNGAPASIVIAELAVTALARLDAANDELIRLTTHSPQPVVIPADDFIRVAREIAAKGSPQ